jgi:hypothetical protein
MIDDIYIHFWNKPKPKFTELELALMEGGHSLDKENKPSKMQFIRELSENKNGHTDRLL